ncbi:preprotein translocase subunit SecG [Winogradskyella sp. R77965]|uniref:preprotein translocase subunit SecG n=1 Tax=Winogradskyella sp. R77965 TaxID=3093872 RepID=UPI0037DC3C92
MDTSFIVFLVLIVVVAFLLVVVIMVQNPKGGGLSSSFGGGGTQQMGGVKKTGDFLDKSTWFLATALIVLILASNLTIGTGGSTESKALDTDEATEMPISAPLTTEDPATTEDTSGQ